MTVAAVQRAALASRQEILQKTLERCSSSKWRAYTKNGTVIRIETDNTVKDGCRVRQLRACLKGRDMRERLYSPDRLKYPVNNSRLKSKALLSPAKAGST